MSVVKIIFASIRKRKGATITFLAMVLIATVMLNISLTLTIGSADFYDRKVQELNAPHYSTAIVQSCYRDEFEVFAKNYEGATDVVALNALIITGSWTKKSGSSETSLILKDRSEAEAKSFENLQVIDRGEYSSNFVILPINFMLDGFKSGDTIAFEAGSRKFEFFVNGFFEDALYGSSMMGASSAYIDHSSFEEFSGDPFFTHYKELSVRLEEFSMAAEFKTAFRQFSKVTANQSFVVYFDSAESMSTTFINLLSILLTVFSLMVLLIAFIVARFSIVNSMQEDITTIGALKSMGYKTRTLRLSQLFQYLSVSAIAAVLGATISVLTFGFMGNIIASTSGLLWLNSAELVPVFISVFSVCGLTAGIVYLISSKYKSITPIKALRQDSNRVFKKNLLPLADHKKIPLIWHLGFKKFFMSLKNNITLFVVVSLLVFISALVFSVSYNLNVDTTAMKRMIGLEMSDIWVQPDPSEDIFKINEAINTHNEVSRTILNGMSFCNIDGFETLVSVTEDFSQYTTSSVIKGRYPSSFNEIALGSVMARASGKGIGDTVLIDINGVKSEYVVVGLTQDIGNEGNASNITTEAILRQNPDYTPDTIYVYLNEGASAIGYIETLKALYGNKVLMANVDEQLVTILTSMGDPFLAISILMIVITIVVIAFVLFLVISTVIRKDKRELGILKAIGYKNSQLMQQMLISMLPSLVLGSIAGLIFGFVLTNPILSIALSSMGLIKTYFLIPPLPTILIGLALFAVSTLTAFLLTLRLKTISPKALIIE